MGRRTRVVTITAPGRDKGKSFKLTEMASDQGERWAIRALLALANAGAKLPEGALEAGMAGLATVEASKGGVAALVVGGIKSLAGLDYDAVAPLLDEMMACVTYVPPTPGVPEQSLMAGEHSQIEEIATRFRLRYEVLQLHVDFSLAGAESTTGTPPPGPA